MRRHEYQRPKFIHLSCFAVLGVLFLFCWPFQAHGLPTQADGLPVECQRLNSKEKKRASSTSIDFGSFEQHAFGHRRIAVLLDEYVDGQRQVSSGTATALVKALGRAGVRTVDVAQAQKLRAQASGKDFMEGRARQLVTSLEADFILAGVIQARTFAIKGIDLAAFNLTADIRLIAADSSELTTFSASKMGQSSSGSLSAIQVGSRRVAEDVALKLLCQTAAAVPVIDLLISSDVPLGMAAAQRILLALRAFPEIKEAKMLHKDGKLLKIEIRGGGTSQDIALALDETRPSGIRVYGASARSIKAKYSPTAGRRARLLIGMAEGKKVRNQSYARALSRTVGSALTSCNCVDLGQNAVVFDLRSKRKRKAALKAVDAQARHSLFLRTSYEDLGKDVSIYARVFTPRRGTAVVSRQATCEKERLGQCAAELGQGMAKPLRAWLADMGQVVPRRSEKPLELVRADVGDIYPSRLMRYAAIRRGAGRLRFKNTGRETLTGLRLTARIEGYTKSAVDIPLTALKPGAAIDANIALVLDREKLIHQDEFRTAVLHVKANYKEGDYQIAQVFRSPVIVHSRNAMSWRFTDDKHFPLASFVDPSPAAIEKLKDQAVDSIPSEYVQDPLSIPIALFQILKGLRYSPDKVHPFRSQQLDYVQYPLQTLARGRGDCDDLAVLYATLLEASGRSTMLIVTQGHALVAFETAVPSYAAHIVVPEGYEFIARGGVVWIPVESTAMRKGFRGAWSAASAEIDRAKKVGGPVMIPIHAAWKQYPGVNLAGEVEWAAPIIRREDVRKEMVTIRPKHPRLRQEVARFSKAPKTAHNLDLRGVVYAKLGELHQARSDFEQSLNESPGFAPAIGHLGNLELMGGHFQAARHRYEQALKSDPSFYKACFNAVLASRLLADNDGIARFASLCNAQPEFTTLSDYLGRLRELPAGQQDPKFFPFW